MSGGVGDSCVLRYTEARAAWCLTSASQIMCCFMIKVLKQTFYGHLDLPTPKANGPSRRYTPAINCPWILPDSHIASIYDFLLNISEGKHSSADFRAAVKAQEILEAAYLSSRNDGEKIQLPLP